MLSSVAFPFGVSLWFSAVLICLKRLRLLVQSVVDQPSDFFTKEIILVFLKCFKRTSSLARRFPIDVGGRRASLSQ